MSSFSADLARALLPISPHLAALHAARGRVHEHHCRRCGDYLPRVRLVRAGTGRVKRSTCAACGHAENTPLDRGNASLFPRVKRRQNVGAAVLPSATALPSIEIAPASIAGDVPTARNEARAEPQPPPSQRPRDRATPSQLANAGGAARDRSKKKPGLQEMLARNRAKEKSKEGKPGAGSGLADFLSTL
ncbi:hypothetical protein HWV62_3566 [Athelia sp. TMB]|nr:hypothetical protein HWV62_3566 [Athelia sp. TMB]